MFIETFSRITPTDLSCLIRMTSVTGCCFVGDCSWVKEEGKGDLVSICDSASLVVTGWPHRLKQVNGQPLALAHPFPSGPGTSYMSSRSSRKRRTSAECPSVFSCRGFHSTSCPVSLIRLPSQSVNWETLIPRGPLRSPFSSSKSSLLPFSVKCW